MLIQPIVRRRPSFIKVNGRYVRNTAGTEIVIHSHVKGDSLGKFPRAVGRISHHRWS